MSTVIIIGGNKARQAVTDLENASLSMSAPQRTNAEQILDDFVKAVDVFVKYPQPA